MRDEHHLNQAAATPAATAYTNLRISWRAIIAGALVAISIQLLLTVLGMAIGLNIAQDGAGSALAIGAGVWWIVTGCISLFFGGWVAGHASRSVERRDAMLQGFVTWTLVTALSALMVTSAIGSVFGGALNLTSTLGSAAGQTVEAVVPDQIDLPTGQVPWQEVESSVEDIVAAYAPQAVEQQGGQQTVDITAAARAFLTTDSQSQRQQRRQRLLDEVQQQFGLSEAEAEQMATELEQTYQQVQQTVQQTWEQTQQTVTEAAQATADVSADAAWWTFFSLLLGALLATAGGAVGARTGGPLLTRAMPLRPVTT